MIMLSVQLPLLFCCSSNAHKLPDGLDIRVQAAVHAWRNLSRRLTHNAQSASPPRHSSIHFNYLTPTASPVSIWYNEVKVLASSDASFFAANVHRYGYAGIQQVSRTPFKARVLFSIWDQLCTGNNAQACPINHRVNVTQCGQGVVCYRFGGEGTGVKAQWEWTNWTLGDVYSFITVASPLPNVCVEYTGYFYTPFLGTWKVLASFVTHQKPGYTWSLGAMSSFVEQWQSVQVQDVRWAQYGPGLIREQNGAAGGWVPITRATWTYQLLSTEDHTHINANLSMSGANWGMGLGGNLANTIGRNADLDVQAPTACPTPLASFVSLEQSSSLPSSPATTLAVSCGGHSAATCDLCPQGNGAGWCNGDCTWQNSACVPIVSGGRRLTSTCFIAHGTALVSKCVRWATVHVFAFFVFIALPSGFTDLG